MSELTKEYLDKKLDKLATKNDLDGGLEALEGSLKIHIEEEVGKLAVMTSNGLEEIKRELNLRSEVDKLKTQKV